MKTKKNFQNNLKYILIALFITCVSFSKAQSYYGTYKGEWFDTGGQFWSFTLHLNQNNSYFVWKAIAPPSVPDTATGKEYLKLTPGKTRNNFILTGVKKDDPHNILLLAEYNLKLSEGGEIIYGIAKGKEEAVWNSAIYGKKVHKK